MNDITQRQTILEVR